MTVPLSAALLGVQGDVSTRDVVYGVLVLVVLLPVLYVIGRVISRVQNRGFARRWAPLMPVLDGATIVEDQGTATTSWLTGRYRGASAFASATPDVARHGGGGTRNGNRFSAGLRELPGAQDWSVAWRAGISLVSADGWSVASTDDALEARITAAGVIARIEPFGRATLRYSARDRTLEWSAYIEPLLTLSPAQLQAVLDALLDIAAMNRAANI